MSSIDRRELVSRHNVILNQADPLSPLTLGNGNFAYSADITGMQSFVRYHDQALAAAAGRIATSTDTKSSWGWHESPNIHGYTLDDAMVSYETPSRMVEYAANGPTASTTAPDRASLAGEWLHTNPHRLDLGRIGLLFGANESLLGPQHPDELTEATQTLDLWAGQLKSEMLYRGERVSVVSVVHPDRDELAFRIKSPLLADGRLRLGLAFPFAGVGFFAAADWSAPQAHTTDLLSEAGGAVFVRTLDATEYRVRALWDCGRLAALSSPHEYTISTDRASIEITLSFSPNATPAYPDSFDVIRAAAARWWRAFWESGAAVEFSGSSDPRAHELERRVILSQYLTAINCAGDAPPQETGLITNSWHGKFHLEMHWWHAAHFAAWARPDLLLKSLPWYRRILPTARETAARQGYEGARWPKQVGPEGRESPSPIGALLIWQQPHILYLLELAYRSVSHPERLVDEYAEVVEETARFMASFVDLRDDGYHLPHPVMPAQESYDARTSEDPTFELAYWWWGLEVAQRWRERCGLRRHDLWSDIQNRLVHPGTVAGMYGAIGTAPFLERVDHPSMLAAFGVVPSTPLIDTDVMRETLVQIRSDWNWDTSWGWDFPMMAMTATRLGEPEVAVDALMTLDGPNRYLASGHNSPGLAILPIYLPANGGLLSAVSLMVAGWDGSGSDTPGFPTDGTWSVRHEGFPKWPE